MDIHNLLYYNLPIYNYHNSIIEKKFEPKHDNTTVIKFPNNIDSLQKNIIDNNKVAIKNMMAHGTPITMHHVLIAIQFSPSEILEILLDNMNTTQITQMSQQYGTQFTYHAIDRANSIDSTKRNDNILSILVEHLDSSSLQNSLYIFYNNISQIGIEAFLTLMIYLQDDHQHHKIVKQFLSELNAQQLYTVLRLINESDGRYILNNHNVSKVGSLIRLINVIYEKHQVTSTNSKNQ